MSLLSKSKNINAPESIDIVNLSDIRNDFGGSLRRYLEDNDITDIIIIFSADINVKNQDGANFLVSMAITTNFSLPEMIEPFIIRAIISGIGVAIIAGAIGCFVVCYFINNTISPRYKKNSCSYR